MSDKYILKNKKPVPVESILEWGEWFEEASRSGERIVKQEKFPNGKKVSTVFLGVDHSLGRGKPLLFETMVFNSDGEEEETARYSTWKKAEKGHKKMVKRYS
jgi:hypothetical protein